MLILGQSYPPTWSGRPPGMTHEDWPVWLMWLWQGDFQDECYYYNVRLGTGQTAPQDAPENYKRMWELSSYFRIDALGVSPLILNVYEVKMFGTPHHVWQVKSYGEILKKEIQDLSNIRLWLIAEDVTQGTREQASQLAINVWTVRR